MRFSKYNDIEAAKSNIGGAEQEDRKPKAEQQGGGTTQTATANGGGRGGENDSTASISASRESNNSKKVLVSLDASIMQFASSLVDELNLENDANDNINTERQSDLCCGFCCDLVKACIVVNSFDIVLSILLIVASFFGYSPSFIDTIDFGVFDETRPSNVVYEMDDANSLDDDELIMAQLSNERLRTSVLVVTILTGCGLIFSMIGIVGAKTFNKWMVFATGFWYCIDVVRCLATLQWINAVIVACFSYPHFALFHALRKEHITRHNYKTTEQYCCCECCGKNA